MLLKDEEWGKWSDREIARQCVVSHQLVGSLKSSLVVATSDKPAAKTYTNKHGTTSTMNTENIGKRKAWPRKSPEPSSGSGDALNCDTDAKTAQGQVKYYAVVRLAGITQV